MNIARFSVTRPVAVTMRIAALVLFGAISFGRLPLDLLPEISLPTVAIATSWENVAPEELEAQITRPIEEAVSAARNIDQVSSNTSEGSSFVRVRFRYGTDMDAAANDVLQLVERARRRFPVDPDLQAPVVFKFDPSQSPILMYGVSGMDDPIRLRTLLENELTPIIQSANGVASAVANGGELRSIMVNVDPARLQAVGMSLADVQRRLNQENQNAPAGMVKEGGQEFNVRSVGWFQSVDEIRRMPLGQRNGRTILLGEVARVEDSHRETRVFSRLDGKPAAGIVITKQNGANTVSTAEAVREKIRQINRQYPNLKFVEAYDQSWFIEASVNSLKEHALLGGALAVLILMFFLRNLRSTFVVALSIPISITSTFALMYLGGFSLNVMSLGGLALATGLIVDDAVVVLENIFRHIERDKKRPAEAAVSGTQEIASAVVASTLTIIVVFLPLLLIKGQTGQMFTQFALVVIFSIAVSLLDALTVVPMLASRMIRGEAHHQHVAGVRDTWLERQFDRAGAFLDRVDHAYRGALAWALEKRRTVVLGALGVTAATFLVYPLLSTEMWPKTDSGDFQVFVRMPVGTPLEKTNAVMRHVEGIVSGHPDVATAYAAAGSNLTSRGTSTMANANQGSVTVKLKHDRKQPTLKVMNDLRPQLAGIPGAFPRISQNDQVSRIISGGDQSVDINIFGDRLQTLTALADEVISRVRDIPGYQNVDKNWEDAIPEVQWRVDRPKAQQLGVTFTDLASTIKTASGGSIAGYYREGGFQYPIVVQVDEPLRRTTQDLGNLVVKVGANGAGNVTLRQVASPLATKGPTQISREDRRRVITVSGQPQGRSLGDIQHDVETALSDMVFPEGYTWDWGSNQKRRAEEFGGMTLAVALAIALVYMLLASQFESFVHPLTVLLSVPLSAIGVVLALFLTGRAFGLTAFIGLLMLVGIVVKNGILLVDYTNVLRGRGMGLREAVLTAAPTRLRPILMTTFATIFGMFPIALGFGDGAETQAPMATAVMGGLATSTMLTLFVVPVVYTLFDDLARRFRKDERDLAAPLLVEPSVEAVERETEGVTP